jgi:hypothetical protein
MSALPWTRFHWALAGCLLALCAACQRAESQAAAQSPLLDPATIRDIMDSMVDPSADYLFESVSTTIDANGTTEHAPQTDEEWREVRRRAMQLLEAPNLLVMPGRKVARPQDKAANPEIELEPEQIRARIDTDPATFVRHARELQDAAMAALRASEAKDKEALFRSAEVIDRACESCHLTYWYPNDQRAREDFEQSAPSAPSSAGR